MAIQPEEQARLSGLREVRAAIESLHTEALDVRGGKTFTIEETLALIGCDSASESPLRNGG